MHPGCLRAGGTAATGSLANPKQLPGKFSTLFPAACKCTSHHPPPPASSLPPDNLLVLLICYFLCKSFSFLHSPFSPEKASGLGYPNLVSWVPLACSYFCVLQGLVTRTFWGKKTVTTLCFFSTYNTSPPCPHRRKEINTQKYAQLAVFSAVYETKSSRKPYLSKCTFIVKLQFQEKDFLAKREMKWKLK